MYHAVTATTAAGSSLGASHTFAVIDTFTLTDSAAASHKLYIIRDPVALRH
jgi:hypothetical protein